MIKLRQAIQKDYKYLYKLKKKTLKEYIAKTWGWDEGWQKDYFSKNFKPDQIKIIMKSATEIGCISSIEEEDSYYLSVIKILPKYQNQGIGTRLIKDIILKAEKNNKPVYLQVLKTNNKAKNLYKRLGFLIEGETDTHNKMVYKDFRG
ncbi:MAG: GNAT family N-acetyltransferase [Candidatus Thorarchaeota archaeon]